MLSTKVTSTLKVNNNFIQILTRLFSEPAISLIGSYIIGGSSPWKTGKTDFSLMLSELLVNLHIVQEVATNIDTFGVYTYISDLETLKYWLHENNRVKLYIFDEANIHLPSRRAMSNKSVDIIQMFPEVSKARARLIVIGQKLDSLDSELRHTGWVRGTFQKINLKTVYIRVGKEEWTFSDLPPTSIKFDPYLQAPFTLKPQGTQQFSDESLSLLWRWANYTPWPVLLKDDPHPEATRRKLHDAMKQFILNYSQLTHIAVGGISKEDVSK